MFPFGTFDLKSQRIFLLLKCKEEQMSRWKRSTKYANVDAITVLQRNCFTFVWKKNLRCTIHAYVSAAVATKKCANSIYIDCRDTASFILWIMLMNLNVRPHRVLRCRFHKFDGTFWIGYACVCISRSTGNWTFFVVTNANFVCYRLCIHCDTVGFKVDFMCRKENALIFMNNFLLL